jgi:hypothetical protein
MNTSWLKVLQRPIESTQYVSLHYTTCLAEVGAAPAIGSVEDTYDNALAESVIELHKTEVIARQGPWRGLDPGGVPDAGLGVLVQASAADLDHRIPSPGGLRGAI